MSSVEFIFNIVLPCGGILNIFMTAFMNVGVEAKSHEKKLIIVIVYEY